MSKVNVQGLLMLLLIEVEFKPDQRYFYVLSVTASIKNIAAWHPLSKFGIVKITFF